MKTQKLWKTVAEGLVRYEPSGVYFSYFRQEGKPVRKSLKTDDFATAKRMLAERRLEAEKPKPVEPPSVGLRELLCRYEGTVAGFSKSTQERSQLFCRKMLAYFGDIPVSKIIASEILTFLNTRIANGGAKSSYNEDVRDAKKVFAVAVKDGALAKSPIEDLKGRTRDKPTRDTPSEEEFKAILETVRHPVKEVQKGKHGGQRPMENEESAEFIEFMGKAGVGNSEAAALKWKNVDFIKNEIRLYRNKTDTSFIIPLYPAVRPLLERLFEKSDKLPETNVFNIKNARKALAHACKRLQMPNYTQRSLRRMFITRCIYKNIPVPTIGLWQGHQDNGLTILKNYSQVIASKNNECAKLLT